jgi:hypothetical protein
MSTLHLSGTLQDMSFCCVTAAVAPLEIWEVLLDNSTIKFFKPLILEPVLIQQEPGEEKCWLVEVPELMISTFGDKHSIILNGVLSDIRDAWNHIVSLSDNRLSQSGKKIKQSYLAIAEEVFDE